MDIKKRKRFPDILGKASMMVLKIGLPIISAALIALTLNFQTDVQRNPALAINTYPDMYSHILAALTLLVLGAMIFDIIEKKGKR